MLKKNKNIGKAHFSSECVPSSKSEVAQIYQKDFQRFIFHSSIKFTIETETTVCPPLGMQLLNIAPKIEAELYLKATNTGLLLHYQSHVDCAIDNSSAENHA